MDSAESLLNGLFFDPRRYDLSAVGRYKFNKKMAMGSRLSGQTLAMPVADPRTGEIIAEAGEDLTRERAQELEDRGRQRGCPGCGRQAGESVLQQHGGYEELRGL